MRKLTLLYAVMLFAIVIGCKPQSSGGTSREDISTYYTTLSDPSVENYILFGDYGYANTDSDSTMKAIKEMCENIPVNSFLTVGDNIYPVGVSSSSDPKFQMWEDSFYVDEMAKVWHQTLGNHDHDGNTQAQVDYVHQYWHMPAVYYNFEDSIANHSKALFLMMDTNPLRAGSDDEQLKYADSVLKASDADWKFAVGHHPLYSGGVHGTDQGMVEQLDTVFANGELNIYIAGHEHDMQYLENDDKTKYVISGCVSQSRPKGYTLQSKFSTDEYGFVIMSVGQTKATLYYVNRKFEVMYIAEVDK